MGRARMDLLSGVLVVDKPEGRTSFDVVRAIRSSLKVKKVGHTGTLDPMATGVLPVCLGKATKLVPFLQGGTKEYAGRMRLGLRTDTDDITGNPLEEITPVDCDLEAVREVASEFVGRIRQVPPAYSALKVGGQPAYRLARKGEIVPLPARSVDVFALDILSVDLPDVSFRAVVSKGTYIRSLAADIGRRLGTGACLESLRRTGAGPFSLDEALPLADIIRLAESGGLLSHIYSPDRALSFLPAVRVNERQAKMVENGRSLHLDELDPGDIPPGPVRIMADGQALLAVYEYKPTKGPEPERLAPLRVLGRY